MYIHLLLIIIIIILYFILLRIKGDAQNKDVVSFFTKALKQLQHVVDVNLFRKYKFERLLKKHQRNINKSEDDVEKINNERIKLEKDLLLCQRCWQFIEDIEHYPTWYKNVKNDDGTPYWKSKAIKPDELTLRKYSSSTLKELASDSEEFNSDDEIIEFCFKLEGNKYCFYVNRELRYRDNISYSSNNGELILYYPIFVFENNEHLVFKSKLFYEGGEYGNYFGYYNLEAFEPGLWVKFLLNKIVEVRKEEEQHKKESRKKTAKDVQKEKKDNFL